ncbi:MAG: diguanylate cyclase [Rhodoferax sp.]|nr:diguanylate cyclase [Rhodoferax sp.]
MSLSPKPGMRRSILALACLAFSMLLWCPVQALAASSAGLQQAATAMDILEDPAGTLTLQDVRTAERAGQFVRWPGDPNDVQLGFSASAYWLRWELPPPSEAAQTRLLEISNPSLSQLTLFVPDAQGHYHAVHTGGDRPFATRTVAHRHFVFPLGPDVRVPATLYLRVQSTVAVIVPMSLWSEADFALHSLNGYLMHVFVFGVVAAIVLLTLVVWVALRDAIYGYYALFMVASTLMLATKTGLAAQYLLPGHAAWSNVAYYALASWAMASFTLFSRRILNTATRMPRVDSMLVVLATLHGVAPLVYGLALPRVAAVAALCFVASVLALAGVALWCAYRRHRRAYFHVAAFFALVVGSLATVFPSFGWVASSTFTEMGLEVGICVALLVLLVALADRFNQFRHDALTTQSNLVDAQQRLVESLQASEHMLVQEVQARTRQLQSANARLESLRMLDGLTGIASMHHFFHMLDKEWARLGRSGHPLALTLLDIDAFTAYQQAVGVPAGDACLRAVAQALASVCRASDILARYGNTGFVLIAPSTDGTQATWMAQRAAEAVVQLARPHPTSHEGRVTISCGIAVVVPGHHSATQQLIQAAETALARAQAQGTQQVVLA